MSIVVRVKVSVQNLSEHKYKPKQAYTDIKDTVSKSESFDIALIKDTVSKSQSFDIALIKGARC